MQYFKKQSAQCQITMMLIYSWNKTSHH